MAAGRGSWWFAGLLACGLAGLSAGQERSPRKAQPKQPVASEPRTLPPGAVARLGHTRLRHTAKPKAVAFAPDGKTFVTAGEDGTLRVWSVATGEQVSMTQRPVQSVSGVAYTHGGQKLAVNFGDGHLRLLDSATLDKETLIPFANRTRFTFSPNGSLLAAGDSSGNLAVLETASELPMLELTSIRRFDFRPDGKAIAVADSKGTVTIHQVTGGKPVFTVKHGGVVHGLLFSPDGKRLAVGSRSADGTDAVSVYEPKNAQPVAEVAGMNLPQRWVGDDALALGNGTDAGVYDLEKKQWRAKIAGVFGEFAASPDGTKLAATGSGLRVRLWDLTTGKQMHAEDDSFPDPALLAGSADDRTLFLLTTDTAYHWKIGETPAKATPAGKLPGRAVAAVAGGDKLVVATPGAVVLYDTFEPANPLPAKPTVTFKDSADAQAVAVSPDGKRVAWAVKGKVYVTDAADKGPRREPPVTNTTVLALAFNPAGDRLGVLGRERYFRLWDLSDEDGEVKEVWKAPMQRGFRGAVAFSPDGKLVTAISTAQLLVFDGADGKPSGERRALFAADRYSYDDGIIHSAAFSPDGRLLIVGAAGMPSAVGLHGGVEVWDVATRSLVRKFSTGYGGVSRLGLFPDGTKVASAGAEEAVTVWDLTFRDGKPAPKADELLAAWRDLESPDAATSYPAVKVLAAGGDRAAKVIADGTREMLATQRKIAEWVEDLGSQTFSIREIASRELLAQGVRALPAITAAAQSEDPEVRDRATEVLKKLHAKDIRIPSHGLAGDTLRLVRAVQALEEIGTPEARPVLESIAAAGGRSADEAKAALARWKKRQR